VVIHLPRGLKGPKRRQDLGIETGTVPRRTIRCSPLAQQLPNLWWKRQQPKTSVSWQRDKGRRFACGVPSYLRRDPTALWWCVPGGTGRPSGRLFSTHL